MRTCRLVLLALLAGAAAGTEWPPMLPDQYGASGGLSDFEGQAVVAIVASGRKLRWIRRWEEVLRAEFDLRSVRIADITDDPRPSETQVAEMLRKRAPENVKILIDLQNLWATTYSLDTGEPCLLLFDSDHNIVAQFRGRPKGELTDQVVKTLSDYFPVRGVADES